MKTSDWGEGWEETTLNDNSYTKWVTQPASAYAAGLNLRDMIFSLPDGSDRKTVNDLIEKSEVKMIVNSNAFTATTIDDLLHAVNKNVQQIFCAKRQAPKKGSAEDQETADRGFLKILLEQRDRLQSNVEKMKERLLEGGEGDLMEFEASWQRLSDHVNRSTAEGMELPDPSLFNLMASKVQDLILAMYVDMNALEVKVMKLEYKRDYNEALDAVPGGGVSLLG